MPAEVISLRFDVEDRGTDDIRKIQRQLTAFEKRLDQISGKAGAAGAATDKLAGPTRRLGGALGGLGGKAKIAAAGIALITVGLNALTFRAATREALSFSKAISEVSTLVDGGAAETGRLATEVRLLSREYGQDQTSQARAFYNAISAGFTDTADAALVLASANELALAGVTDVATGLDGLLAILKPYSLGAEDASRASDQLFETVKRGITTVSELSSNLGQVTPVASQVGVSTEEVLGAIATITATTKLSTSEATTQVNSLLRALLRASETVPKFEKEFGIEVDFGIEELREKGLVKFIADLNEQLEETGQKEAALLKLTGRAEALGAALTLAGPGAKAFAENVDAIGAASGTATEAVDKVRESTAQQFEELKSDLADLSIEIGQQLLPLIIELSRATLDLINASREGIRSTGEFITFYTGQIQKAGALAGAVFEEGISRGNFTEALATFELAADSIDRRFDEAVSANDSKRQAEAKLAGQRLAQGLADGLSSGDAQIAQATAQILGQAFDTISAAGASLAAPLEEALKSRELEAVVALRIDVAKAFDDAEAKLQGEFDRLASEVDAATTTSGRSDALETRREALFALERGLVELAERRAAAEEEIGRQVDALTRKREAELNQLRLAAEASRGEAALRAAGAPESRIVEFQGKIERDAGLEQLDQLRAERELAATEAERLVLQEQFTAQFSQIALKRAENLQQVKELRQQEGAIHDLLIERIGLESDLASARRTSGAEDLATRDQVKAAVEREFDLRERLVENSIADLEAQLAITDSLLAREEIEARIAGLRQEQTDLTVQQTAEEKRRLEQFDKADGATSAAKRIEDAWTKIGDAISGAATDALLDYINGTKSAEQAFEQFAISVLQQIQRIIVETLVAAAIQAALGAATGGLGGVAGAAVAHDGGLIVRKYHSGGLAADEVPAILQTGEFVVSRRGVAAAGLPALRSINRGDEPAPDNASIQRVIAMGVRSQSLAPAPAGDSPANEFAGGGGGRGPAQVEKIMILSEADLAEKMANSTQLRATITQIMNEEDGG